LHFGYKLRRASDNDLLAEGETTHVATTAAMKVSSIPQKYLEIFRNAVSKTEPVP
jgi:acyl-CoA thioesterase FadM